MKRSHVVDWAVGFLAVAALAFSMSQRIRDRYASPSDSQRDLTSTEFDSLVAGGDTLGAVGRRLDAVARVVIFTDLECPYCAALHSSFRTDSLVRQAAAHIVIIRHAPGGVQHPAAFEAATVAKCAARSGVFTAFADVAFEQPELVAQRAWEEILRRAGIADTLAIRTCRQSRDAEGAVAEDTLLARKYRVRGTPTLFIEGIRVRGAVPAESLKVLLNAAAASRRSR